MTFSDLWSELRYLKETKNIDVILQIQFLEENVKIFNMRPIAEMFSEPYFHKIMQIIVQQLISLILYYITKW